MSSAAPSTAPAFSRLGEHPLFTRAPARDRTVREAVRSAALPLRRESDAGVDVEVRADVAYQRDPLGWIRDVLGVPEYTIRWSRNPGYYGPDGVARHTWDGTPDPFVLVLEALAAWKDVGVESATGTGKTFLGACVVLWFVACFEDATVVTAAPKEKQLTLHIWKEIGRLWPRFQARFPGAELTTLRIRMRAGSDVWAAHGFACGVGASEDSATKAQGFHAEHMLIITEETPGIHGAIMTAFEQTSVSPHNLRLAFGNPDHQLDALHTFCASPGVAAVRISAHDHPNVVAGDAAIVPGAASAASNERRRKKYGPESRLYRSRVRGISPAESADALIRLAWCEAAAKRAAVDLDRDPPGRTLAKGVKALGVDVANSENGDKAAIARGEGACLLEVESFPCPDANALGRRVHREMAAGGIDAKCVGVDSVGVGAGTVNECKRLGVKVQALNGADAAVPLGGQEEEFVNLRSQMWWQLRTDLQHERAGLPNDPELFEDLTMPTWTTRGGKIAVESKEDIKKRLGRSPDKGDAAVYWNWVRQARKIAPYRSVHY